MSTDTLSLVRDYLAKVGSRDVEGATAYFADDLAAHVLGRSGLAGDYSRDEMSKIMNDMFSAMDVQTQPIDVLASDEHVVAVVRSTFKGGDQSYTGLRVVVYRVADDKIHELWVFDEDQRAIDAVIDAGLK